ncbi:glycosyltransferase family 2 protein [Lacticaseibacillus paracasei]|uniref:Glycosyltransferase family 2 protein n=1 Tax=Lacticaseibacillus paracasei TaxID=1597 RepID=A0AAW6A7B0_LACPA|nr:glycosyltransferase family 2 protein [Lacticaseibacillus paracasei]MDB1565701.1 glycosyltransferase family 2 protein [Lacticaseibacillus paracasei]
MIDKQIESIYAGVVTFNPNLDQLEKSIQAIQDQVSSVIVFDNGSDNISEVLQRTNGNYKVKVLRSSFNIGIAAALNRLMKYGEKHNYVWMLALDQDSICSVGYVAELQTYIGKERNIGIIAPTIVDRNVGVVGHTAKEPYKLVRTCITSGAIYRIDVWSEIGGYDESMFIDSVDFEYCYRLRAAGYNILLAQRPTLSHALGNSQKHHFLFFRVLVTNHSAFRKYYISRNNIYYPMKHHLWILLIRGNIRNAWLVVQTLLYESNKAQKVKSILTGWRDGYRFFWKRGSNAH